MTDVPNVVGVLKDDLVAERVRGLLERHAGADDDVDDLEEPPDEDPPDDESEGWGRSRRHVPKLFSRLIARVPVRLDPGHRAAVAVGLAVLVAAVITGAWLLTARPRSLTVSSSSPIAGAVPPQGSEAPGSVVPAGRSTSGADAAGLTTVPASPADVVVDVAGKVRHPGVYHLPPQSRVADAVAAAGGPRQGVGLTNVNLAAKLVDGQQILIGAGVTGAPPAGAGGVGPGSPGSPPAATSGGPINVNTANLEQLESLPGIGPALGQRILDWRAEHGSFSAVDQLKNVSGIGDARFADLKPLVTV